MDKNLMSAEEASLISANIAASLSEDARIKKDLFIKKITKDILFEISKEIMKSSESGSFFCFYELKVHISVGRESYEKILTAISKTLKEKGYEVSFNDGIRSKNNSYYRANPFNYLASKSTEYSTRVEIKWLKQKQNGEE